MQGSYLQVNDLSNLLGGLSPQAIYKMLKAKKLESIMVSTRKKVIPPDTIRKILLDKGFKYPKQILSFDMIKGGVGKTTLSSTVGMRASHYGCRTLIIDFDLQGNLSRSFDIPSKDYKIWIDLVKDNVDIQETVINISPYLDIIPSNLNNSRLDIEMQHASINIKDHVRDKLDKIINNYDLVIIDCPPAINKVSASAICASDTVIIPLNPDPYAMDGLIMTLNEIKRIKQNFKIKNPNYMVVWNKYDARKRLGAIYMHDLASQIKIDNIMPVVVRTDTTYENSIANAASIFEAAKSNNAKEDIDQLAREIIGINKWIEENHTDS
ncbi:ParA family protein [Cysteiniphilum sp. 6C5]|uniref:ParA family protein n=1 Tax=unclassified Cysteiniphilum TaxID=2610889 RepID=UPI003F830CDF